MPIELRNLVSEESNLPYSIGILSLGLRLAAKYAMITKNEVAEKSPQCQSGSRNESVMTP